MSKTALIPVHIRVDGSPVEVGANVASQVAIPTMAHVEASGDFTEQGFVHLWAGFIGAMSGAMAARIGVEAAQTLLEAMAQQIPIVAAQADDKGRAH